MNASNKKSNLEQKLYLIYHQDGILDLVVGIMLLIFAAVVFFDQGAFIGIVAIPAAMYIPIKQQVAFPRMGYIRFESAREQRLKLSLALVLGFTSFLGLVVLYFLTSDLPEDFTTLILDNILLIFGTALGIALAGAARFLQNRRFYLYAGTGVALVWAAHFTSMPLGIAIGILATIVEGTGITILVRFLSAYPIQERETHE